MPAKPAELRAREQDKICGLLAQGLSLNRVCKLRDMPTMTTVMRWLREDASFARQYALARESQADTLADRIIDLADKVTPMSANADRVRIDALKWVASKLKPRKYGDRVALDLPLPSPTPASEASILEGARRIAFAMRRGAEALAQQRQPRPPLMLEGCAEVVEPVPVYREVDHRPKPAAPADVDDPLRALNEHRRDLERVREENLHVTPGEMGWGEMGRPRVLRRRPFSGGEE